MDSDRWVMIVDPKHVWRAAVDEVWHPVHYPQRWCPVMGIAGIKCYDFPEFRTRCRLCDVPSGIVVADPGEGFELVEPWEIDPYRVQDYWRWSAQVWDSRAYPHHPLTGDDIYRRPIAKPASKTPQPGEWWVNENGSLAFIHGYDQKHELIYEYGDGQVAIGGSWKDWRHKPACTGWDWQPPQPEAEPEEPETDNITVSLTDREREVLLRLSGIVDLPPDRVMIQALRHYQTVIEPVNPLTLASAKCEAEPEPLTLEQRVESLEERLKKLEHQVSELEDS